MIRPIGEHRVFEGLAASHGQISGPVFVFRKRGREQVPDYEIDESLVAHEISRLDAAFDLTHNQIHSLSAELRKRVDGPEASIFEGHAMILEDPSVIERCHRKIIDDHLNPEMAVHELTTEYAAVFEGMEDEYLRERASDIYDIGRRIIHNLMGHNEPLLGHYSSPCIVVADELSPSETIALPRHQILGFVTDRGSLTSHASLLSRALGIPAVVGIGNLSEIAKNGEFLLLDGTKGRVILNPTKSEIEEFHRTQKASEIFTRSLDELKNRQGLTSDGFSVPLIANIDSSTPMSELYAVGAEGVGLYRSEYLWLTLNREPTEEEQVEEYTKVVRSLKEGQEITIRVLDLGGDKIMVDGDKPLVVEANPFLGNRSIRYLLRNPDVFKRQLRAILCASAHGSLQIVYPMISVIEELLEANELLEDCKKELSAEGREFDENIKRGVMVEVPSAALIAEALAEDSDFFSLGTNDLIQYAIAVDRLNETIAKLYQPAHPGVLRLIDMTVRAGHEHNNRIAVCGEMASDPVMAVLLYGMGIDELSMTPQSIPIVKKVFSCINRGDALKLAEDIRNYYDRPACEIYRYCKDRLHELVPDVPM
ncbi:MAG: phosphoenolpyruvate--protein phosphotransferase [Kiritimatiellia bacterium]